MCSKRNILSLGPSIQTEGKGLLLLPQFRVLGEGCVEAHSFGSSQDMRQSYVGGRGPKQKTSPVPALPSLSQQGRGTLSQSSPRGEGFVEGPRNVLP